MFLSRSSAARSFSGCFSAGILPPSISANVSQPEFHCPLLLSKNSGYRFVPTVTPQYPESVFFWKSVAIYSVHRSWNQGYLLRSGSLLNWIQERLWRSCRGVIKCEAFFHWPRLRSAGGFILERDWTPTKTKLLQLATYRGGSLIFIQDDTAICEQ